MPLDLIEEFEGLTRALHEAGVPHAVCGGIAVTIHGATRSTKDIDLLVRPEDLDRVRKVAAGRGFNIAASPMTFDAGTPREMRVHRVSKFAGAVHLTLDLIEAGANLEAVFADRQQLHWRGRPLWVVSRRGLETMKRMAGRLQDLSDLEKLDAAGDEHA